MLVRSYVEKKEHSGLVDITGFRSVSIVHVGERYDYALMAAFPSGEQVPITELTGHVEVLVRILDAIKDALLSGQDYLDLNNAAGKPAPDTAPALPPVTKRGL